MMTDGAVPNNLLTNELEGKFENLKIVRENLEKMYE